MDERGIEPRLHREHHGLGGGGHVNRDQMVGHELHLGAIAEGPDVTLIQGEPGDGRQARLIGGLVTAAKDDEFLRRRMAAGSADRTVEKGNAGGLQLFVTGFLDVEGQGAGLHEDRVLWRGRGHFVHDLLKGAHARKRKDGHLGPADGVADSHCGLAAMRGQ